MQLQNPRTSETLESRPGGFSSGNFRTGSFRAALLSLPILASFYMPQLPAADAPAGNGSGNAPQKGKSTQTAAYTTEEIKGLIKNLDDPNYQLRSETLLTLKNYQGWTLQQSMILLDTAFNGSPEASSSALYVFFHLPTDLYKAPVFDKIENLHDISLETFLAYRTLANHVIGGELKRQFKDEGYQTFYSYLPLESGYISTEFHETQTLGALKEFCERFERIPDMVKQWAELRSVLLDAGLYHPSTNKIPHRNTLAIHHAMTHLASASILGLPNDLKVIDDYIQAAAAYGRSKTKANGIVTGTEMDIIGECWNYSLLSLKDQLAHFHEGVPERAGQPHYFPNFFQRNKWAVEVVNTALRTGNDSQIILACKAFDLTDTIDRKIHPTFNRTGLFDQGNSYDQTLAELYSRAIKAEKSGEKTKAKRLLGALESLDDELGSEFGFSFDREIEEMAKKAVSLEFNSDQDLEIIKAYTILSDTYRWIEKIEHFDPDNLFPGRNHSALRAVVNDLIDRSPKDLFKDKDGTLGRLRYALELFDNTSQDVGWDDFTKYATPLTELIGKPEKRGEFYEACYKYTLRYPETPLK